MKTLASTIALLLLSTFIVSAQTVIYVDSDAIGSNNGKSWSNAYTNLDTALAYSVSGDSIWVAKGIYKPDNKNKRFDLLSGRKLYGGFSGTETTFSQRDIANNLTALDGDINNPGQANDNCDNVLFANNVTTNVTVDGFTIRNGYQYTIGGSISNGGGGAKIINSRVTFNNCTFRDNYTYMRGGAIYSQGSSTIELNNCTFHDNTTGNSTQSVGGAIFMNSGTLKLNWCYLYSNRSRYGGALYSFSPTVTIDRTTFAGNEASSEDGGAIYIGSESTYRIYNSLFVGNYAKDNYAAIYTSSTLNTNSHRFINCTFAHNSTSASNGRTVNASDLTTVRNCIFWGNKAPTPLFNLPPAIEPTVGHNIIEGGISYGTNNIDKDPKFVTPGKSEDAPFTIDGLDYSLQATSPAVNTGNNSYLYSSYDQDLYDSARTQGVTVDMGAIESPYTTYTITINSGNTNADDVSGGGAYLGDSSATISTAVKNDCFTFKHWLEKDTIVSTDTSFTISVNSDRTFTSVYTQKTYVVNLAASPANRGSVIGSGTYFCNADSSRTFIARANKCQEFINWTDIGGNVVSSDTHYTLQLTSDLELTANFKRKDIRIQLLASPGAGGTVSGAGVFPCDSFILVSAVPNSDYTFSGWKANGSIVSSNADYSFNAVEDLNLIGEFKKKVGVEELELDIEVYPNPASNTLNIKTPYRVNEILITSIEGKQVASVLNRTVVDISALAQGNYIALIKAGSKQASIRFTKK